MPDVILDQYGAPAQYTPRSSSSWYNGSSNVDRLKFSRPQLDRDILTLLSSSRHRMMLSDARYISQMPVVQGMIQQKADYVCGSGWLSNYEGKDPAWGEQAEELVLEADKICDVRGQAWDFAKLMEIACRTLDIDGDFFIVLTQTETGWPKFQMVEAHRVGSRGNQEEISTGPYKGARIVNGIIYDRVGAEIAHQVLGDTEDKDQIIPSGSMLHAFDPKWFSEGRPLPSVAYSVVDWYDIKDIRENEKIAQRVNSSLTLIEENEQGKADPVRDRLSGKPSDSGAFQTELIEGGLIRYVKSGKGKITAHGSNRPSSEAAEFEAQIIAGAAYGMGWRIEMMDLSKLTGAGVRGFQDNINTCILGRFKALRKIALAMRRYQVAKFIKRGDLPTNADWWRWDFTPPPEFTVDAGRSIQSDIDAMRAGLGSEHEIIPRVYSMKPLQFYRLKARAVKAKMQAAKEEKVSVMDLGYVTRPGDQITTSATQI